MLNILQHMQSMHVEMQRADQYVNQVNATAPQTWPALSGDPSASGMLAYAQAIEDHANALMATSASMRRVAHICRGVADECKLSGYP